MITGERGIGKSSLLLYLSAVAEGAIPIGDNTLHLLVVDTSIDASTTQLGLVKKIEIGLRHALEASEPAKAFWSKAWSFVERVETGPLKIRAKTPMESGETFLDEFVYSLAAIAARLCSPSDPDIFTSRREGILVLIDEADNGSRDLSLGSFLKLVAEGLQRRGCNHVMFGLAGLTGLRELLVEGHPSAVRLFEENTLGRLTDDEVGRVIDICIAKANESADIPYSVTPAARDILANLSEGYPHFIQQFGYCAFAADTDNAIDEADVIAGAFRPRGGLDLIGDQYYRDNFYNKIQKDSYRQVLRIMADRLDGWITKAEIRQRFKGKPTTLDNAIHALRERHIIVPKEGEKGVYRLQHKGFALWIKLRTTPPETLQKDAEQHTPANRGLS